MSGHFVVRGFWNRLAVLLTGRTDAVVATAAPVFARRETPGVWSLDRTTLGTTAERRYMGRPILYVEWPEERPHA